MKNEFVPYEEALALKELGFKGRCFKVYDTKGFIQDEREMAELALDYVPAPLYQQAFRWFREKYNLFILMQVGQHNGKHQTFYFNVFKYGVNLYKSKYRSNTGAYIYEEAQDASLKKLIEIIKQN